MGKLGKLFGAVSLTALLFAGLLSLTGCGEHRAEQRIGSAAAAYIKEKYDIEAKASDLSKYDTINKIAELLETM